jgi:hypothetical protein
MPTLPNPLAALVQAVAFAADSRYTLTLRGPGGPPSAVATVLSLDCVQGAFALASGDASAVQRDGLKLRGKVTVGDAWYDLDCVVTDGAVPAGRECESGIYRLGCPSSRRVIGRAAVVSGTDSKFLRVGTDEIAQRWRCGCDLFPVNPQCQRRPCAPTYVGMP